MVKLGKKAHTVRKIQPNIVMSAGRRTVVGYTLTNIKGETKTVPVDDTHATCASVVVDVFPPVKKSFPIKEFNVEGVRNGFKQFFQTLKSSVEVECVTREEVLKLCQKKGCVRGLTFYDGLGNQMFPSVKMKYMACEMLTSEKVWNTFTESHVQVFVRNGYTD